VTNASGSLIYSSAGLAGELTGTVNTNIPGVDFDGTLGVAVNTTGVAQNSVLAVGSETVTLDLPAGPYLRLSITEIDELTPATLTIGGQTLSGNFALEQVTSVATGSKIIRLVATDVELHLLAGSTEIVSLTEGEGALLITAAGIAGRVSGTVQIGSITGGASFSGRFSVAVNNTRAAVVEQLTVAGVSVSLNLPAGPYVRVEATGARLVIFGQTLSGDFAFEQATGEGVDGALGTSDDDSVIRVGAANVTLSLGDGTNNFVSVTNGSGYFLILPTGIAGTLSATVAVNVPSVTFSGTFRLVLNNTSSEIDETFTLGVLPVTLRVAQGPYLRVDGTNIRLNVLGQTLTGNFAFEQVTLTGGARLVRVAGDERHAEPWRYTGAREHHERQRSVRVVARRTRG
jgi:hypothetical protein